MKLSSEPCGMAETAFITNIQHFSLHDGPGIRTTVFFKGCNLHCAWCHNPETVSLKGQVGFDAGRCIGCGTCGEVCPTQLHKIKKTLQEIEVTNYGKIESFRDKEAGRHEWIREGCLACGRCVEACPANALELYGRHVSIFEIEKECMRDKENFPGFGGVTFSGGECLLQARQVFCLASKMKTEGIHVCVDTALHLPWDKIEGVLSVTDLFLVDMKAGLSDTHKKYVGMPNDRICENLKRLTHVADCWIRIPVVHGVNDTKEEVGAMLKILGGMGGHLKKIQLLTYHTLGESKYRSLGLDMSRFEKPDMKRQEWMLEEFRRTGVCVEWN